MSSNVWHLIKADFSREGRGGATAWRIVWSALLGSKSFRYCFWFRLASCKSFIVSIISRVVHKHYSMKYQVEIPRATKIGPGLYLGHCTGIVISSSAVIGKNCNISHFVNVGSNHGKAALIGDDVYIGPMVCIVEDVVIGDRVTIGAGAVVVKSIEANATCVGSPARVVNFNNPARYIKNKVC